MAGATHIHLVGAGGAGMSALAKLLFQQGRTVTGSDMKHSPALAGLSDLGIEVWAGSVPQSVVGVDLVVASSAVPATDPELVAAHAAGVTVWQRPQLLGALTAVHARHRRHRDPRQDLVDGPAGDCASGNGP